MLNIPSAYFGTMFYVLLLLLSELCCAVHELSLLLYTTQTDNCLVFVVCALSMYIQSVL